jgi:hypothetical protein
LLEAYAAGWKRDVVDFMNGKEPSRIVRGAFEDHGAEKALRVEAEARAFGCCTVEWLNRYPVRSLPSRCHGCGQAEHAHDPLLPFGTEYTGHTWLHSRCWPTWRNARKAEAIAALAAMEIHKPRMLR